MNIVFCFMDGGEDQEEFVKEKLMKLHYGHPTITGATFGDAANRALTTLTEKIESHAASVAAK